MKDSKVILNLRRQIDNTGEGKVYKIFKVTDNMFVFSVKRNGIRPEDMTDNMFLYLADKNACREFQPSEKPDLFEYALQHKIYG